MTGNMPSVFTVYKTLYNWTQAKCPNLVFFQNKEQVSQYASRVLRMT